jgi:hypothetical protein
MSQVGFKPVIPVFERAKAAHALDRAATVIGEHNMFTTPKHKYIKQDSTSLTSIFLNQFN